MVSGEHDLVRARNRHPTARLGALARFIDDDEIELSITEQLAIDAGRRDDHARAIENAFDGLILHAASIGDHLLRLSTNPLLLPRLRSSARPTFGATP